MTVSTRQHERVIEVASAMKAALSATATGYRQLLAIIDAEHEAIRQADLRALEQIISDKETTAEFIQSQVLELQAETTRLAQTLAMEIPDRTLTGAIRILQLYTQDAQDADLGWQVLEHVIAGMERSFAEFSELRRAAQPKVEMNKYLTEQLLMHHRQSYQFWQDVKSDSEATYSKKGVRKAEGQSSMLSFKA